MKTVSAKIVLLTVVVLTVIFGVWVSIGSKVGSLAEYPACDSGNGICASLNSKIEGLNVDCSNTNQVFEETNDMLQVSEQEGLLSGDDLTAAWSHFGDKYLGTYLDCKISHFHADSWSGKELTEVKNRLAMWKRRSDISGLFQMSTIQSIEREYSKYPRREGVYKSEEQAKNEIAQMKQYSNNEYLRNCVTIQNNVSYFQSSMGDSHIGNVLAKEMAYTDPNSYFEIRSEFESDVQQSLAVLERYKEAAEGGRYGRSHPNQSKVSKAEKIIDDAIW